MIEKVMRNWRAAATCSYIWTASQQTYGASGGTGSVIAGATNGCGWTAQSDSAWLKIRSGGSGTRNSSTGYSLDVNLRAGQTFTITEAGTPAASKDGTFNDGARSLDWNGDGKTEAGAFINGYWYLDYTGVGVFDGSGRIYAFGQAGDTAVVGQW